MRINMISVLVDNQERARRFCTKRLGFRKKTEVPLAEDLWLTVVSPSQSQGPELLLEPDRHPAAKEYKRALAKDGIPDASFARRERIPREAVGVEPRQELSAAACPSDRAGHGHADRGNTGPTCLSLNDSRNVDLRTLTSLS